MATHDYSSINLPAHSIYKSFTINDDISSCTSHCSHIRTSYTEYPRIYNICCSIEENLIFLKATLPNDATKSSYCSYLFYWIHENISEVLNSDKKSDYSKIISDLVQAWDNIVKYKYSLDHNVFKPVKVNGDMDNVSRKKKFFDYCNNYQYMKDEIVAKKSCYIYYNYLKDNIDIYNEFKEYCFLQKENCPYFLNIMGEHDPETLLRLEPCTKVKDHNTDLPISLTAQGEDSDNDISSRISSPPDSSPSNAIVVYTPFSLWLHKLIKIRGNTEERSVNYLLEDATQYKQENLDRNQYDISYKST
ncbi:PIR Superfamily Protein [Plasmodium ovale curtisi]|uniref:PIR Superfamily Protein n=1 Tax=Plasmodium ovale curtisi TaxID=864141 RepID=A0A1A8WUG7_PLAOA|nr:PIR Superfamily Protein [Plasmodium ovale curtisi]SBT02440.1 PIR Superfamily Protein [Plasmodium ovale curtisi]